MIGAKVNNRIVPIDHQVVTGEIIEIITGPENRGPSRDWLNIVKTSEAKNKIRNWFKKERRDENIAEGKDAFEKELRRNLMVIPPEQYDEFMSNLARRNHCNSVDEMYAAIGYGGLQLARILPKLKEEYTRLKATEPKPLPRWISSVFILRTALWWKALTTAPSSLPSVVRRCRGMTSSVLSPVGLACPSTSGTAPMCSRV